MNQLLRLPLLKYTHTEKQNKTYVKKKQKQKQKQIKSCISEAKIVEILDLNILGRSHGLATVCSIPG